MKAHGDTEKGEEEKEGRGRGGQAGSQATVNPSLIQWVMDCRGRMRVKSWTDGNTQSHCVFERRDGQNVCQGAYLLALGPLGREPPQRQRRALPLTEGIRRVLPVLILSQHVTRQVTGQNPTSESPCHRSGLLEWEFINFLWGAGVSLPSRLWDNHPTALATAPSLLWPLSMRHLEVVEDVVLGVVVDHALDGHEGAAHLLAVHHVILLAASPQVFPAVDPAVRTLVLDTHAQQDVSTRRLVLSTRRRVSMSGYVCPS